MFKFLKNMFAAALLLVPLAANAQIFQPCDARNGCTMQGYILFANPLPAVTGTGTPTILAGSSNTSGQVTAGASATSVVITFGGGGYAAIPLCTVTDQSQITSFAYTVSKTAITITQTATSGNLINYHCDPSA